MLIINDTLNKRFCKKVFGSSIFFFFLCYVHNIFTILRTGITQIYSTLLIYLLASCIHTQPISLFFFFFFLFLPIFLSHKSQPYTFCLLSFSPFSTFLHTFSHTSHTHAILHLDLLYSFLFL